jgi:hypothetical protein
MGGGPCVPGDYPLVEDVSEVKVVILGGEKCIEVK